MDLHTRRSFLKNLLLFCASLPLVHVFSKSWLALASGKGLPTGKTAVLESDPVAKVLGYRENVKDIDFNKYPQRKKSESKNQFCNNCALYTAVNSDWGQCQMLTSGLVTAKGWCGSWNKKS